MTIQLRLKLHAIHVHFESRLQRTPGSICGVPDTLRIGIRYTGPVFENRHIVYPQS
jgi:hypothetical protein